MNGPVALRDGALQPTHSHQVTKTRAALPASLRHRFRRVLADRARQAGDRRGVGPDQRGDESGQRVVGYLISDIRYQISGSAFAYLFMYYLAMADKFDLITYVHFVP